MTFSEKLTALLSLTATKNVTLANAVNVDTAQISRMKTGARKMPLKTNLVHDIAAYMAGRFDSEYKLSALYELTGDVRLQASVNPAVLAGVLYDWLVAPDDAPAGQAGRFLGLLGGAAGQPLQEPAPQGGPAALGGGSFIVYYQNEGKRQAVRDFFSYVLALDKPCTLRLFTDESSDWLMENSGFSRELTDFIQQITLRGFRVQRVQPPITSTEGAFRAIERWLPAYMAGSIRMFYYPWTRDRLHRRTLFVAPGHVALYAASLHGQNVSQMTFLTRESSTIAAADAYYSDILERCRTMMSVFSADDQDKLLERLNAMAAIQDAGVYKSSRLSAHTLPASALPQLRRRAAPFAQRMLDCFAENEKRKPGLLRRHVLIDIMLLPELDHVLAGREPIPGTKNAAGDDLYYTPQEYRLHLKHIVWYLETFPNYQAVLLDDPALENVVIYTKGDEHALLVRDAAPFTLFEVTERGLAASLCDYLRHMVDDRISFGARKATIERLKQEIRKLESMAEEPRLRK